MQILRNVCCEAFFGNHTYTDHPYVNNYRVNNFRDYIWHKYANREFVKSLCFSCILGDGNLFLLFGRFIINHLNISPTRRCSFKRTWRTRQYTSMYRNTPCSLIITDPPLPTLTWPLETQFETEVSPPSIRLSVLLIPEHEASCHVITPVLYGKSWLSPPLPPGPAPFLRNHHKHYTHPLGIIR